MHKQALDWLERFAMAATLSGYSTGIDVGGRETNGHARWLFPYIDWTVIDAVDGPGVDIVANGATWTPDERVDLVLFAEVAEHSPLWRDILRNIHDTMLKPDGLLLFTAAGPGREPHGLHHDDPDQPGYYQNITFEDLADEMAVTWTAHDIDIYGEDIRAWAKP